MANTLKFGNGQWATKEGLTLAYNDENGNFKPLPFTFDRASSATRVNKDGLIETVGADQPRIDFLNDSKGALKLEPSRTNSLLQSNQFDTSYNLASGLTLTENSATSPDGNNNAWKFESDGSSGFLQLNQVVSVTGSNTLSIFAKKGTNRYLSLRSLSGIDARGQFDLELGLVYGQSNASASIEDYGNGWYRCSMSFSGTNNTHYFYPNIQGTADGGYIYIYSAQLEQGSYATSIINTSGSAVTRVADNAYQQGVTQVIGQSEGTMFIEFIPKDSSTLQILYQAKSSSGVVGQIDIRLLSGLIRALANDGGGSQFFINGGSYAVGTKYKVAIRYKLNDSKLYINGTDSGSDTSCSFTGSSLDQVSFADSLSSHLPSVDIIDSRLYNTALSDSELQALTS